MANWATTNDVLRPEGLEADAVIIVVVYVSVIAAPSPTGWPPGTRQPVFAVGVWGESAVLEVV